MVVLFQKLDGESNSAKKHGALHNGEILESYTDDFEDRYQFMQHEASPHSGGLPSTQPDTVGDVQYEKKHVFHRAPLSLKNEFSVKQQHRPPYGYYASIQAPWEYREQLVELDCTESITPPDQPVNLDEVSIWQYDFTFDEAKTSTMLGISPTGLVFLNGARKTPIEGVISFYIPDKARKALVDTCLAEELFSCDHTFIDGDESAPLPAVSTGIRIGETEKWVHDYTSAPPEAVERVEQAIRTACYLDRWLEPDFETLLAGLQDETEPDEPYLSILYAAVDQNVIEVTKPRALFEAVEPSLSAASNFTRFHAAKIAAQAAHAADRSAAQRTELLHRLLDDDDDEINDAAGDLLSKMLVFGGELVASILNSDDAAVTERTVAQLPEIAKDHPGRFAPHAEIFATLLREGNTSIREDVALILKYIAEDDGIDETSIHTLLIDNLTESNDDIQRYCVIALAAVAKENNKAFVEAVPAVAPLLESQWTSVRKAALTVLREVSRTHPEEIRPAVPQLVDLIESEELTVETTSVLGRIAKPYPAVAAPLIDTFKEWLDIDDTRQKNNALASLVDLANTHPDEIIDRAETFIDLLDAEDEYVQRNAVTMVSRLSNTHPERFTDAIPTLREYLDYEHPQTQANACWALGRLNAVSAQDDLEELRDESEPDTVRAGAIAALTKLETDRCPECNQECQAHRMDLRVVFPVRVEWDCPHCEAEIVEQLAIDDSSN